MTEAMARARMMLTADELAELVDWMVRQERSEIESMTTVEIAAAVDGWVDWRIGWRGEWR